MDTGVAAPRGGGRGAGRLRSSFIGTSNISRGPWTGDSTDVPPPFELRLRRTWAYAVTDDGRGDGVGRVRMRFLVRGLYLSPSPQDSALLFDDDGDFSDARVDPGQAHFDEEAEAIEFTGVALGPERYFALAVKPL